MSKVKIYIDIPEEIKMAFIQEGRNLETVLSTDGAIVGKEEILIEGEHATRGYLTYIVLSAITSLVMKIGEKVAIKVGEKTLDKFIDSGIERILGPVFDKIKNKTPDKEIKIELYKIVKTEGDRKHKLVDLKLPSGTQEIELAEDLYIKIIAT